MCVMCAVTVCLRLCAVHATNGVLFLALSHFSSCGFLGGGFGGFLGGVFFWFWPVGTSSTMSRPNSCTIPTCKGANGTVELRRLGECPICLTCRHQTCPGPDASEALHTRQVGSCGVGPYADEVALKFLLLFLWYRGSSCHRLEPRRSLPLFPPLVLVELHLAPTG